MAKAIFMVSPSGMASSMESMGTVKSSFTAGVAMARWDVVWRGRSVSAAGCAPGSSARYCAALACELGRATPDLQFG
jgi:hypothetical protein